MPTSTPPDYRLTVNKFRVKLSSEVQVALARIGSHHALTWPVAALSFIWASYISVGFDRTRFDTAATGWFLAAVIAHLIVMMVAIPFRLTILSAKPRASKPVQTLLVFAFLGLVRSTVVGELVVFLDLAPSQEWGYRQIAGIITVTTGLSVTTMFVAAYDERRRALAELIQERNQLVGLQQQAESLFEENREEVHQIIDESIRPSLEEISGELASKTNYDEAAVNQTTKLISALIDDRLRPVSDALHEPNTLSILDNRWTQARAPIFKINTKISVKRMISPILIFSLMSAVTISGSIYYAGFVAVLIGAIVYLPFLAIATLGRTLIPETWKLNIWAAIPITALVHIGAAFPSLNFIRWLDGPFPGVGRQFLIGTFGFAATSVLIALLRAAESERESFENDFREANSEALAILNKLNQRIWTTRKSAAQLLHGSVQAALTAANLRLRSDQISGETLSRVREDIERALESLANQSSAQIDLEDSFEELIELWDGVCAIDISISPDTLQQVSQDVSAAYCVNEFLRECINNAIKHGQATEIEIQVTMPNSTEIEVEVINNGTNTAENRAGLGTRILAEITTQWNRSYVDNQTRVWGRIAFSAPTEVSV